MHYTQSFNKTETKKVLKQVGVPYIHVYVTSYMYIKICNQIADSESVFKTWIFTYQSFLQGL